MGPFGGKKILNMAQAAMIIIRQGMRARIHQALMVKTWINFL